MSWEEDCEASPLLQDKGDLSDDAFRDDSSNAPIVPITEYMPLPLRGGSGGITAATNSMGIFQAWRVSSLFARCFFLFYFVGLQIIMLLSVFMIRDAAFYVSESCNRPLVMYLFGVGSLLTIFSTHSIVLIFMGYTVFEYSIGHKVLLVIEVLGIGVWGLGLGTMWVSKATHCTQTLMLHAKIGLMSVYMVVIVVIIGLYVQQKELNRERKHNLMVPDDADSTKQENDLIGAPSGRTTIGGYGY